MTYFLFHNNNKIESDNAQTYKDVISSTILQRSFFGVSFFGILQENTIPPTTIAIQMNNIFFRNLLFY